MISTEQYYNHTANPKNGLKKRSYQATKLHFK